jgi:hypothetical protein
MEMSNEKFEYAEKILVKLRDNAKDVTKTLGAIIGDGYGDVQNADCASCGGHGSARLSKLSRGWIGYCCRVKSVEDLQYSGSVICGKCGDEEEKGKKAKSGDYEWGICDHCIPDSGSGEHVIGKSEIDKQLKTVRSAKSKLKQSSASAAERAIPYISAGLAEPFALAIANGTKYEEVLDLWESKWWKQYEATDILICSVLDGTITEDDGKWLNSVRSDHERLALTCVENPDMMEWARTLLENGFDSIPNAVNEALDGAEPVIIARIRNMEVNKKLLPPALKKKVELKNPPKHMQLIPEKPVKKKKDTPDIVKRKSIPTPALIKKVELKNPPLHMQEKPKKPVKKEKDTPDIVKRK